MTRDDENDAKKLQRLSLREEIERRAMRDPEFAIAFALLELADEVKALGGTVLRYGVTR